MPDLEHTLQGHDLGFLKIVASAWAIELSAPDAATALPVVAQKILEHAEFAEVIDTLPSDAKNVLQALLQSDGRLPWAEFVRKYGDVRRMGQARRDRERPDIKPSTAVEVLWYRGLVGRAFLTRPLAAEPQEYAYIPEDLLPLLPLLKGEGSAPLGRPATPNEAAFQMQANDSILDHACTLLAALRIKVDDAFLAHINLHGIPFKTLQQLLYAAGLLDHDGLPHPERTRSFLEAPRGQALSLLVRSWMESQSFNELRLLPGLKFEGEWSNDPHQARSMILELVGQIPENRWWSLSAFIHAVHDQRPDFQRPTGDYDSWFIRQESSGSYLRGFSAWGDVEGALVRFLICGPMHWLGLVDLAAPAPEGEPSALRLSRWAAALWHGKAPEQSAKEDAAIKISADGLLSIPVQAPRAIRYQVARFCRWEGERERNGRVEYLYRITPAALERAKSHGLRASQLVSLLRRHCDGPFPPVVAHAVERWENNSTQAVVENVTLLQVTSPEILAALKKSRAARCLGETLNETTVIIHPGMAEQVQAVLIEIGYLSENKVENPGGV